MTFNLNGLNRLIVLCILSVSFVFSSFALANKELNEKFMNVVAAGNIQSANRMAQKLGSYIDINYQDAPVITTGCTSDNHLKLFLYLKAFFCKKVN